MSARSAAAPDSVHSAHPSSLSLEFRHGWPLSLCTGGPGRHADTFLYSYQWWVADEEEYLLLRKKRREGLVIRVRGWRH
jgi:hypothetical protein